MNTDFIARCIAGEALDDTAANKIDILSTCCVGTCETAGATAEKVITIDVPNWTLRKGVIIGVRFFNTNTASNVTFNVNNSGAKRIYFGSSVYLGTSANVCGGSSIYVFYQYDGTYWVWLARGIFSDPQNMSQLEASTGTATAGRLISAKVLNDTIEEKIYGSGEIIPDNSDLNDYRTPGKYGVSTSAHANTISNIPEGGSGFTLLVMGLNESTSYVRQTYIKSNRSGYYYVRHYTGSWSDWYKFEGTALT